MTLILNVYSTSDVMWYNSVPNLNEIEQSAAELQRFENLKFGGGADPHFGFQGKWSAYQIWVKSNNPRWSYSDLKVEKLGTVRHLGFDRKLIFKILRSSGTDNAPSCQFSTRIDSALFLDQIFNGAQISYQGCLDRTSSNLDRTYTAISDARQICFWFKIFAPFANMGGSKVSSVKYWGQISHFNPPCKNYRMGGRAVWVKMLHLWLNLWYIFDGWPLWSCWGAKLR